MDLKAKIYLERAENELRLAKSILNLSGNERIKVELEANPDDTFYSAVISHSYSKPIKSFGWFTRQRSNKTPKDFVGLLYYSIFYCAKAVLFSKGIKTEPPEEHKNFAFKENFVDNGLLDEELLRIYGNLIVKADELLNLFAHEKWKRGQYTYKTIAQANVEPARESIENTIKFLATADQQSLAVALLLRCLVNQPKNLIGLL